MIQHTSKAGKAERESAWRDRLARHASSGQSIDAFCQSESISSASFYGWRSRLLLRAQDAGAAVERTAALAERRSEVEVRIDMGDGVLLTIVRR